MPVDDEPDLPLHNLTYHLFLLLRNVIKHFCVATVFDEAACRNAAEALLQYSTTVEKMVKQHQAPAKLLSNNLHVLNCRLEEQELARVPVAMENEMWIDRLIQVIKQLTKFRVSADPERVVVNTFLLAMSLYKFRLQNPNLQTLMEVQSSQSNTVGSLDDKPRLGSSSFLGPALTPKRLSTANVDPKVNEQMVSMYVKDMGSCVPLISDDLMKADTNTPCAFGQITLECMCMDTINVFARANRVDDEILHSILYTKTKSRDNTWILVNFDEPMLDSRGRVLQDRTGNTRFGKVSYIGRIKRFLLAEGRLKDIAMNIIFRLAVCELWKAEVVNQHCGTDLLRAGKQWQVKVGRETVHEYPVDLQSIEYKLNSALVGNDMFFLRPFNASRRL